MDFALDRAIKQNTNPQKIGRLQLLYDIMCIYGVHLEDRFKKLAHLDWPQFREFIRCVGVWHIYAHIPKCYGRYSPLYALHTGIVDGEILETLWSLLNNVTQSCRSMSLANREETINFHMNDINWKKTVEMSKSGHSLCDI
jgi:hypothetical protein